MTSVIRRRRALRGEEGFTLIELLVVMVASVVVLGALFTILDVTLRQTSRTFSMVDASQQSRIGLEKIENELHSACLGAGQPPIQTASSATSLVFISQYGSTASNANAASLTPVQHTITFNSSAGTLTDTTTAASNANTPWTFGGASSTRTILGNVTQAMSGSTALPVFQYFRYVEPFSSPGVPYTDAGGHTYEMLMDGINAVPGTSTVPPAAPLTVPLSSTDATNAAEVLINLRVKPTAGSDVNSNQSSSWASVSDQVVLRLTPPDNHAGSGADFSPCL